MKKTEKQTDTLCYENIKICSVIKTDDDFLNMFGHYDFLSEFINDNSVLALRIKEVIALSRQEANLILNEIEDDNEWNELIKKQSKYEDSIEGNWNLLNGKSNEVDKILVPCFHDDNSLVWRWNLCGE